MYKISVYQPSSDPAESVKRSWTNTENYVHQNHQKWLEYIEFEEYFLNAANNEITETTSYLLMKGTPPLCDMTTIIRFPQTEYVLNTQTIC